MGSTHGHVDSKNSEKLSSMTTHGEDFQGKSFARSRAIIPVNNKMNFGDQISDNQTNYSKFLSISGQSIYYRDRQTEIYVMTLTVKSVTINPVERQRQILF